jgi:hypothetical protein
MVAQRADCAHRTRSLAAKIASNGTPSRAGRGGFVASLFTRLRFDRQARIWLDARFAQSRCSRWRALEFRPVIG